MIDRILAGPRARNLPNLEVYLRSLVNRSRRPLLLGLAAIIGGLSIAGLLGLVTLAASMGLIRIAPIGMAVGALVGNACCWLVAAAAWMPRRERKALEAANWQRDAAECARRMLASKRLHKELNPAAAQLLEESARYWREITTTTAGPFWSSEQLPGHWAAVRDRAIAAADQAMAEELAVLGNNFEPSKTRSWEQVMEDAVETFAPNARRKSADHVPAGFAQARETAEKLKLLARDIRAASDEISTIEQLRAEYPATSELEEVLGDLHAVRKAETELREDLRH